MCTDDAAVTAVVAAASRSAADSEVFDVAGVVVGADPPVDAAGVVESPHPTRATAGAASKSAAMSDVRSERFIAQG